MVYGAADGGDGSQLGGLDSRVARLRDGFDRSFVVDPIPPKIEIMRLVVAAYGNARPIEKGYGEGRRRNPSP